MLVPTARRTIKKFWRSLGFTQIEILVIVFVIGIMAALVAPSFGGMLETAKMKQASVELRSAFQETQRQSIRNNKTCETSVFIPAQATRASNIKGACLASGDRPLPERIGIATNISPVESSGSSGSTSSFKPLQIHRAGFVNELICEFIECPSSSSESYTIQSDMVVNIAFGRLGSANFSLVRDSSSPLYENSAKFVSYRPHKQEGKKSCVVISRSLGLTRIGTYQGSLNPADITDTGKCQVASWTEQ